jgi:hypothetical protein
VEHLPLLSHCREIRPGEEDCATTRADLAGRAPLGVDFMDMPERTKANASKGEKMTYRTLGRTGMKVSPYALGAMMFGARGNPDHDDSIRIIHKALDAGSTWCPR